MVETKTMRLLKIHEVMCSVISQYKVYLYLFASMLVVLTRLSELTLTGSSCHLRQVGSF